MDKIDTIVVKTKNKNYGFCSICKEHKKFSFDHIPPRSCGNNGKIFYYTYDSLMNSGNNQFKKYQSQNGVKFCFICSECNSYLGSHYDVELKKMHDYTLASINNSISENIPINLDSIIKSILGHLLASVSYEYGTIIEKDISEYYFKGEKPFLEKYSLYFSYYPYKDSIFILNNYVVGKDNNDIAPLPKGMISSFYFYPFAFIFMQKQNYEIGIDLLEIHKNNNKAFKLNIFNWTYKNVLLSPLFPANVSDDIYSPSFMLIHGSSTKNSIVKIETKIIEKNSL